MSWQSFSTNTKTIVGAIALALFIRITLFEAFEIEGPSMEPSLLNGDRVVVAKFLYGLFFPFTNEAVLSWGSPDLGDVIIVKSPADNIDIVKRVVGLPKDTIQMLDNVLYRNGKAISRKVLSSCKADKITLNPLEGETLDDCRFIEEKIKEYSFLTSISSSESRSTTASFVVPEDHVFVLGDHRDHSNDSRYFGTVPVSRIKGRSLFVYWSRDDATGVRWNRLFSGVR